MTNTTDTSAASTPNVDAAPMFPYIFISVAIVVILQRLNISVIASMLSGIKVYLLPMHDPPANSIANKTGELAQLSRKQQKRLEKSKQEVAGTPDSIQMYCTDANYIKGLLYYSLFDGVVVFLVFYLLNCCLSLVAHYYNVPSNPALEIFAASIIFSVVYCVGEVDFFGEWTLNGEKVMMAMAGVFCTVMSGLLLLLGPKFVLDFGIEAGTRQLNANLKAAVTSAFMARPALRHLVPSEEDGPWVDSMSITALLAMIAGAVSAVTLGSCTRWAKLYMHCMNPPYWGLQHFNTSRAMAMALGAGLLAPLATVVLWIVPLTDVMGLDMEILAWLRPASTTLSGFLHLFLLRKLISAFFMTAMLEWWGITNRATAVDPTIAHRVRVRNQFLNMYVTGKVVLQLLGPAIVLVICGTIHIYSLVKERAADSAASVGNFVQTWAGFLSWWTSLWWFGVTSLTVTIHRVGFTELSSS